MAVSFDYGKCGGCGREQSKTLQNCRECGIALPWNKVAKKVEKAASASPKMGIGDIAWAAMGVQILGGFIFLAGLFLWCGNRFHFFPTFPFAGYITICIGSVLWGVGSRMD
jgi:fatty acid desaturase